MSFIKNILSLLILFIFFSGCKNEDEEVQPSIISFAISEGSVNDDFTEVTVEENTHLKWAFNFDTEIGIKVLIIEGFDTHHSFLQYTTTYVDSVTNKYAIDVDSYHKTAGDTLNLQFTVIDELNQVFTANAMLNVIGNSRPPRVQTAAIEFELDANNDSPIFYSLFYDTILSSNDVIKFGASSLFDLGFFVDSNAALASPSDFSTLSDDAFNLSDWPTKNKTQFIETTMTTQDLAELSSVEEVKSFLDDTDFPDGNSTLNDVSVDNKIYAYELVDSRRGLLRIIALKKEPNTSSITLEFTLDTN